MPEEPLVSQHLEHIKFNARRLSTNHSHLYSPREGVYALYRKGTLYYVGLLAISSGVLASLKDRQRKSGMLSVSIHVNAEHLKELESLMLRVINQCPKAINSREIPMSEISLSV